jgi:integrase
MRYFSCLRRYGLREGEICRLRLEDVNWREESLHIRHTKTNAHSAMPLLAPVGEALFDYFLRHGRPRTEAREVRPVLRALYRDDEPVWHGQGRLSAAGVEPPGKRGPHVFRHARAVEMLRASVLQKIIGDVLGHRSTESTNTYLKLATDDLRAVALDVPGMEVLS